MAVAIYYDHHKHYPAAYVADAEGTPLHSWRVALLPYLNETELHKQYDFSQPWDGPNNRALGERMPRTFAFAGDYRPGLTTTNFLAVVGPETVWPGAATLSSKDVTDGTAHTILIVENAGAGIPWLAPRDLVFAEMKFKLQDPAEISSKYLDPAVAMLDCSVTRLHKDITPATLRALLTIRGGEQFGDLDGTLTVLPDGRQRELAEP
jgi:hypothetical protein